jgi:TonB family protein
LEGYVRSELIEPLPGAKTVKGETFNLKPTQLGGVNLSCLRQTNGNFDPIGRTWCLDPQKPILVIDDLPGGQHVIHTKIVSFQDHFIASDLRIVDNGKVTVTAHLDSLEPLGPINEADFTPPAGAAPWTPLYVISPDIAQQLLTVKVTALYPVPAQKEGVKGTVRMKAIIDKKGRVEDLQVLSGPDLLRDAATHAVKEWVFEPYRVDGEPVRFTTWFAVTMPN